MKIFSLAGRSALITGGGRGIGRAIALLFSSAGAKVLLVSRTEEQLRRACGDIKQQGGEALYFAADLSERAASPKIAAFAQKEFGPIDIVVHNAGVLVGEPAAAVSDSGWNQSLELNLSSGMALAREFSPQMVERKWGRFIFLSSIMGFTSRENRVSYSSTKTALLGLAKALAAELGPYGITANCIAPGPIETEMTAQMQKTDKEVYTRRIPAGRWGLPDDIAAPALLLASDAGSFVNGPTILVDGGLLSRVI